MIELNDDQLRALSEAHSNPLRLVNPRTNEAFVLLPVNEYQQLASALYDDSPWTREELSAIAAETDKRAGRDCEPEIVAKNALDQR